MLTIDKAGLTAALAPLARVASTKKAMAILAHTRLAFVDDFESPKLRLFATDLEVSVAVDVPVDSGDGLAVVAAPAIELLNIVKGLPGDKVVIADDGDGWIRVSSGKSKFRLAVLNGKDVPVEPSIGPAQSIPGPGLVDLIRRTSYAMGADGHFKMSNTLLEIEDGSVALVATDGHRLARAAMVADDVKAQPSVLIPKKAILQLQKFIGDASHVNFSNVGNHVSFQCGDRVMFSLISNEGFPPYRSFMNKGPRQFKAEPAVLADSIKRVSVLSEPSERVFVDLGAGAINVSVDSVRGQAEDSVQVTYEGPEIKSAFRGDYLSEFLSACDAERVTGFTGESQGASLLFEADGIDHSYVLMPMNR